MKTRILVTGVGAPGSLGTIWALRNNPDGEDVFILGTDVNPDASGRLLCDEFETLPWPEDQYYHHELNGALQDFGIHAMIVQTTREARLKWPDACDKAHVTKVFEGLGFPTPNTEEIPPYYYGMPNEIVAKPRSSNGSRGIRILTFDPIGVHENDKPGIPRTSYHDFYEWMDDYCLKREDVNKRYILQEYLPGHEYTVDCFIGSQTRVAVPRKRLAVRSGITSDSVIEYDSELAERMRHMSLAAGEELGLKGVFGFQYKLREDGTPCVLECNPRVQGTMVHAALAGANVVWMDVCEQVGLPYSDDDWSVEDGLRFQRLWGGITNEGVRV